MNSHYAQIFKHSILFQTVVSVEDGPKTSVTLSSRIQFNVH